MQRRLRELSERSKALLALQRWFQRHKLARDPSRSWRQTLKVLQLSGRQADAAAKLEQAGANESNFALHHRNGDLVAGDPRSGGVRVRCCAVTALMHLCAFGCAAINCWHACSCGQVAKRCACCTAPDI
jgi:hypothetical protein